ncbi:RNase adapter RapZ [Carboxydochorda subterranea]|uniref:RNase adapter RapZ n=1 Tax=Carboxydichorda subterranea TaxID=3109565 RepID=A0ABZ1BZM4_9FIRM|nr:RNase adapter RapZ [Limnochorda sp. L945t]WRP18030.1 RNase adapter RapZ [Limnochorda sp. L945t]
MQTQVPREEQPATRPVFVIVTGLSGAGKTEAMRALEDLGFFCVDNLPPALIPTFAELCQQSGRIEKAALVSDARGGEFFDDLFEALKSLERRRIWYRILFLEASDEVLVRRFKETRRRHPLAPEGSVLDGIRAERQRLEPLRGRSDIIIDTSSLTPRQLREQIGNQARALAPTRGLAVTVVSFGYARGIPIDADLIFDVRFLPNPHYVPALQPLTGNDPRVEEYVFGWPVAQEFMERLGRFVDFLLPQFVNEGKSHLLIGIGCTGGRHRSVAVANRLARHLRAAGYEAVAKHRDVDRPGTDPDPGVETP